MNLSYVLIAVSSCIIIYTLGYKYTNPIYKEAFSNNNAYVIKKQCKRNHSDDIPEICEKWIEKFIDEEQIRNMCKHNPDYIKKTDIPSCPRVPDMSLYIKKTNIPSCPQLPDIDMSKYIKKTNIPSCPTQPDMSKYIKKTNIPSCPTQPDMSQYIKKTDLHKFLNKMGHISGHTNHHGYASVK